MIRLLPHLPAVALVAALSAQKTDPWLDLPGGEGPGAGKTIVFVTGDEEYRSEESMPLVARILAERHGFTCRVCFAIDPDTGHIDPKNQENIPGLEALAKADLMVIFTRFRDLPDDQMKHIVDYVERRGPIVGLRTATHAFDIPAPKEGDPAKKWRRYTWRNKEWPGGFGSQILGETWVAHHGGHGSQSTRGDVAEGAADHPILRGVDPDDVWDPADVYTTRRPQTDPATKILLWGTVLAGMKPSDPAAGPGKRRGKPFDPNDPKMPIAWVRHYGKKSEDAGNGRVFTTTLGASRAFAHEGTRRMVINGIYWAMDMDGKIQPDADVSIVGAFEPSRFGFGKHREGVRPIDLGR